MARAWVMVLLVGCSSSPSPFSVEPGLAASSGVVLPLATVSDSPSLPAPTLSCPADMVLFASGTFTMGPAAHAGESETDPAHTVKLSAYCLDKTEVTLGAYRQCEQAGQCSKAPTTVHWDDADKALIDLWSTWCTAAGSRQDRHPINCVDWHAAAAYCKWADKRLPTEAEWERAARGPRGRKHPWGEEPIGPTRANTCGAECQRLATSVGRLWPAMHQADDGWEATAPVGSFPAGDTPEGVSDLAGNVWEWVHDVQGPYPTVGVVDPQGPASNRVDSHIMRGGGWYTEDAIAVRGSTRNAQRATDRYSHLGFRCAARPKEPS